MNFMNGADTRRRVAAGSSAHLVVQIHFWTDERLNVPKNRCGGQLTHSREDVRFDLVKEEVMNRRQLQLLDYGANLYSSISISIEK